MKKQLAAGLACYMLATTAQADVVIGNPMAVTGPIPDLVAPMVAAVDLAEKHINEQGGMFASGEKFVVVRADSQCDPVAAVDAVTKLINVSMVTALVGPVCSGATIAQAESVSIPAGVVTLSVSASSPRARCFTICAGTSVNQNPLSGSFSGTKYPFLAGKRRMAATFVSPSTSVKARFAGSR